LELKGVSLIFKFRTAEANVEIAAISVYWFDTIAIASRLRRVVRGDSPTVLASTAKAFRSITNPSG
jgi:hypothetical protein